MEYEGGNFTSVFSSKKNVLFITAGILAIVLLLYYFFGNMYDAVKTETVYSLDTKKSISTKLFALRDEKLLENEANGIVVPLVNNGDKLAKGDLYAVVCSNTQDAESFMKKNQIQNDINRYEKLNGRQNLNALEADKEIDLSFANLLNAAYQGNYKKMKSFTDDFGDRLTSRQNAFSSQPLDFNVKINLLKEELRQIDATGISVQGFNSEYSGYYSSNVDGYEKAISYENIDKITTDQIENAINSSGFTTPPETLGKVICNFNWYLLAVINNSELADLKPGDKKQILIGRNGEISLDATVYALNPSESGKTAIVFMCNQMNEDYSQMRIEDASIVMNSYKGLKIKSSAVRTVDNLQGVFILQGNVVGFRQIITIDSRDDYVVAKILANQTDNKGPDYLSLYDEVIVEGKNLYEGKIVRR